VRNRERDRLSGIGALALALLCVMLLLAPGALADGTLDPSFGTGGVALSLAGKVDAAVGGATTMPNGDYLTGGTATQGSATWVLVTRHLPTGFLDPTFNSSGLTPGALQVSVPGASQVAGTGIVYRSDTGRSLVSGWANFGTALTPDLRFLLIAVTADGRLDTSFDPAGALAPGIVATEVGNGQEATANAIVQLADHSVILVGTARDQGANKIALVKYDPGAAVQAGFGNGTGIELASAPNGGVYDEATAAALETVSGDLDIVFAGFSYSTVYHQNVLMVGAADAGFGAIDGAFGRVPGFDGLRPVGSEDQAFALAIPPAGSSDRGVYVGGYATVAGHSRFVVARYGPALPHGTFGPGFAVTPIGSGDNAGIGALEITLNGEIVAAGSATDGGVQKLALARYRPDGTLDPTFGSGGTALLTIGDGGDFAASLQDKLLVQRPTVIGSAIQNGQSKVMIARVIGDDAYRPTLTVSDPTANQFFVHAPSPIVVRGTFRADLGVRGICATAGTSVSSDPPPGCSAYAGRTGGSFAVTATGTLPPGDHDWVAVYITDSAGHVTHQFIPVQVASSGSGIDVRVTGMEVTQAISSHVSEPTAHTRTVGYAGVQLVANRATILRAYADAASLHGSDTSIPGIHALLHIYNARSGREVRGSPLLPDVDPRTLHLGPTVPPTSDIDSPSGAYTFTIPPEMSSGRVNMRVELNPAPGNVPECASCTADDSLTLDGVGFRPVQTQEIMPLAVTYTSGGVTHRPGDFNPALAPSSQIPSDFALASRVYPFPLQVDPYQGVIDASTVMRDTSHDDDWKNQAGNDLVSNWQRDNGIDGSIFVDGITPASAGNALRGVTTWYYRFPFSGFSDSITIESRPLTAEAHEMGHYEGLSHASGDPNCYPQPADQAGGNWPPDQHGYIEGIGLDPQPGSAGAGLYRLFVPGLSPRTSSPPNPAYDGQYFDFMSYCASTSDNDSWISTVNWDNLVQHLNNGPAPARDARAGAFGSTLAVQAVIGTSDSRIVSIRPAQTPPTSPAIGSPYHVIVRSTTGSVLSDTALGARHAHVDPGPGAHAFGFTSVSGVVSLGGASIGARTPRAGGAAVGSVTLEQGNQILAQRLAPPHVPAVRIISPKPGARVRGSGTVSARWSVRDPDKLPLQSSIDYSGDGGRHWRTLETGTPSTSFVLPARFFTTSHDARVRVRVSDSFHTAVAISGRFRADGAPPAVAIIAPRPSARVRADAVVGLIGEAFDENDRRLHGRSLAWYRGKRLLGHGDQLMLAGLPAGQLRLRLVAKDRRGRTSAAAETIRVVAVTPVFIAFRAPRRLSRHARHLALAVGSSVPATLVISGRGAIRRSTLVSRRARRISVAVRPGRKTLVLTLTLRAHGARPARAVVMIRR
jgi:uncharacterized delta-60 repeat protein